MSKAKNVAKAIAHAMPAGGSMIVPISKIRRDPKFNVRKTVGVEQEKEIEKLADSIEAEGQIQDVLVEPAEDGFYDLRVGYRRVAAIELLHARATTEAKKKQWETVRASLWIPTNQKGEPLTDPKEIAIARFFVNLVENVQRSNVNTYDLGMRVLEIKRDLEVTGGEIATRLGKTTGYINNLLAILGAGEKGKNAGNTLHPRILAHWQTECSWSADDDMRSRICKLNVLRAWVALPHEEQLRRFERELWIQQNPKKDAAEYDAMIKAAQGTSAAGAGAGNGGPAPASEEVARPGKEVLEKALDAAQRAKKTVKKGEQLTRINGVIEGLKFALGVKKGLTNRIAGVCAFRDKEMVEGAPPSKDGDAAHAAN